MSFKYLPLILETLGISGKTQNLNKIIHEKESLQLDFKNDKFLRKNKYKDYPEVAKNIYGELEKWQKKFNSLS